MLLLEPTFLLASAAITRKKIKIGATARNALTKICPSTPKLDARSMPDEFFTLSFTNATRIPSTKPTAIRFTKLPWNKK